MGLISVFELIFDTIASMMYLSAGFRGIPARDRNQRIFFSSARIRVVQTPPRHCSSTYRYLSPVYKTASNRLSSEILKVRMSTLRNLKISVVSSMMFSLITCFNWFGYIPVMCEGMSEFC